jgi:hypothetical protein
MATDPELEHTVGGIHTQCAMVKTNPRRPEPIDFLEMD